MFLNKFKEPLLVFSFILILFLFLFGNVLDAGYILDDHSVIENREELKSFSAVYKAFLLPWHQNQPWAGNYRPLTLLSYALTLSFSESTAVMRIINIVIHSANAALVFYLVMMFFSRRIAYFTAIGFAVLPINTGTILSLVGRSDLLSAFFILISLILFYKERHVFGAASFSLALSAKEFSIFLLPIIMIISVISEKYNLKKVFIKLSPYFAFLVPYFLLRYLAMGEYAFNSRGSVDPIIGPLAFVNLQDRISTGFVYFYLYLRKTFVPFDLSPDYSFNQIPIPNILGLDLVIGASLFALCLLLFFRGDLKSKTPILLFLVPFGVISNTFFVTTGVFAERWWYFPSIGLFWFASVFTWGWFKNRSYYRFLFYSLILAAGIYYLYVSFEQARIWTNERKLFVAAAQRSPNSAWARTNLAAVYFKERKFDLAKNEVGHSLKISENYPAALNIYAKLKWREEDFEEAESAFKRAIEYDLNKRNHRDLYRSLAILKLETKNYNEAMNYMKNAKNSAIFGDKEKAEQLDSLLDKYIIFLRQRGDGLSGAELKIIAELIRHIRGF